MAFNKKTAQNVFSSAKKVAEEAQEATKKTVSEASQKATESSKKVAQATKKAAQNVKKSSARAVKNATEKKTEIKKSVAVQFNGNEYKVEDILSRAEEAYKSENKRKPIKELKVYIKPEDNAAYYVVNNDYAGKVDL